MIARIKETGWYVPIGKSTSVYSSVALLRQKETPKKDQWKKIGLIKELLLKFGANKEEETCQIY